MLAEMPVCRATSASVTVVASKHKASKHKSAIDKPLNSSKMLHRNVSQRNLFGSSEDLDVFMTVS